MDYFFKSGIMIAMAAELASGSKGPVAIILSGEEIEWMSCRSILPNLLDAYRLVFKKNLKTFCLRRGTSHREVLLLAKKIAALRPASVVFLGYRYQPARLIVALNLAWGDKPASPIFIHTYGNFTRQSPAWWHLNSNLLRNRIQLVCASSRHAELVNRLLFTSTSGCVTTCPFPVDDTKFNFFPELRVAARRRLGILPDEKVFFISGRISRDKGVVLAARAFLAATRNAKRTSRLLVAGKVEKGSDWPKFIKSLPQNDRKRIQYLGLLNQDQLVQFYNASDVGLSMSMYHDEDFGMVPAEALCTGARMIISSWGGYASFRDNFGYCSTVPVRLSQSSPISEVALRKQIERELGRSHNDRERHKISAMFRGRYSIRSVANVIAEIHEKMPGPFPGFGDQMYQLAIRMFAQRYRFPAFPEGRKAKTFYAKIYGAYCD